MADWFGIASAPIASSPISGEFNPEIPFYLAASEAADTAAANVLVISNAQLAASDTADSASISVTAYTPAAFAVTDATDVAAASVVVFNAVALAATEARDAASAALSAWTPASLAANDNADTASIALAAQTRASFALVEPTDSDLEIVEVFTPVALAVTETPDQFSASAALQTRASFSVTEPADNTAGSINFGIASDAVATAPVSGGFLFGGFSVTARTALAFGLTEARDTASVVVYGYTPASFALTEPSDVFVGEARYYQYNYPDVETVFVPQELRTMTVFAAPTSNLDVTYLFVQADQRTMIVSSPVYRNDTYKNTLWVEVENRIMYVPSKVYTGEDPLNTDLQAKPRLRAVA